MKHKYLTLLLALLMSMVSNVVFAYDYDFKVGGIYYKIISSTAPLTVSVTRESGLDTSPKYTGNVNIPETVTYNGKKYSVTDISSDAFNRCTGLTSVTIPNSVKWIGYRAFLECSGLTSVSIGNSVIKIYDSAFEGCSGLTSVTIPNSVTSIGGEAFYYCTSLTSVTIGNSVKSIGQYAFDSCRGLTKAEFASVESLCGISFYDTSSNPLSYAHHLYINGEEVTDLDIPNSVTSIGNYTFENCSGLTSVTIPNSVTSIGGEAFMYCSALNSVNIPENVTSIGNYAFYGCSALTSVNIPNSVDSIGEYAFMNCSGLTSVNIGNSVTSIGKNAFHKCSSLTSINIPNSVTKIEDHTFSSCSALTSVTIPESVTTIGESAFFGCSKLVAVFLLSQSCSIPGIQVFPRNITLYVLNTSKYSSLKNVVLKHFKIPETEAEAEYCGSIPTLDFQCTEGFSVKSYDTSLLTKDVGTYQIPVTLLYQGVDFNYHATVNITKKGLTAKANNLTKTYGEENPELTISYVGFVSGEDSEVLQTQPQANTTADKTSSVGDYDITVSGATANNYEISYQDGKLTIEKAPLIAKVENSERSYGKPDPVFTATYIGFVNGDNEDVISTEPNVSTTATVLSDVGVYDLVATGGSATNYYFSEYQNGTLTIVPAPLTVCANNKARLYYEENPELTYTCCGFMNSDNISVFTTQPVLECSATMLSDAGTYPITIRGAQCKNYALSYEDSLLTINKRTLEIIPDNAQRKYGEENPRFIYSLQGFVSNQNKSVIDEMPEIYTTATKSSDVGTYEICSRGGEAKNYDFNYDKKGTLTINKAEQTIIWEQDLSKIKIGDQIELLAYATSGLEVEYLVNTDVDGISVYTSGGKNYLDCYSKGSYYVRATQAGNKNYEAALRVSKNVVVGDETAIGDITENESDCKVYDIKGNRLSKPQRGINIVRMKDGTTKKVLIK